LSLTRQTGVAPHQPLAGSPLSDGEREVAEPLLLRGKVFHFPEKGKESLTSGYMRKWAKLLGGNMIAEIKSDAI